MAEEAGLWMSRQFLQHAGHGQEDWEPFVNFPGLIDAHADQKHDKLAVKFGGHLLRIDVGHEATP